MVCHKPQHATTPGERLVTPLLLRLWISPWWFIGDTLSKYREHKKRTAAFSPQKGFTIWKLRLWVYLKTILIEKSVIYCVLAWKEHLMVKSSDYQAERVTSAYWDAAPSGALAPQTHTHFSLTHSHFPCHVFIFSSRQCYTEYETTTHAHICCWEMWMAVSPKVPWRR